MTTVARSIAELTQERGRWKKEEKGVVIGKVGKSVRERYLEFGDLKGRGWSKLEIHLLRKTLVNRKVS